MDDLCDFSIIKFEVLYLKKTRGGVAERLCLCIYPGAEAQGVAAVPPTSLNFFYIVLVI
jgi:hypothetical protein